MTLDPLTPQGPRLTGPRPQTAGVSAEEHMAVTREMESALREEALTPEQLELRRHLNEAVENARKELAAWVAERIRQRRAGLEVERETGENAWLSEPDFEQQTHRVLDLLMCAQTALKRVPPGMQGVITAALRSVVDGLMNGGPTDTAVKGAENVLALALKAATKGDELRGLIAQLRSVTKAVPGPAQAVLGALADAAEGLLNSATSLAQLDGLKSFLERALEIANRLKTLTPGSPEYSQAVASLSALAGELRLLKAARERSGEPAGAAPRAELELEQEAPGPEQFAAIAAQAEQLT